MELTLVTVANQKANVMVAYLMGFCGMNAVNVITMTVFAIVSAVAFYR